jgi:enoyl-CoA hydratase/carnithine racemase
MTLDDQIITQEKDGHVARLTPNRPGQLNATSQPMPSELRTACDDAMAGDPIRAIVLPGADKAYSSGGELQDQAVPPLGTRRTGPGPVPGP